MKGILHVLTGKDFIDLIVIKYCQIKIYFSWIASGLDELPLALANG